VITYYANGLRKTMSVTGQPTLTYTYDNANRLIRIDQAAGTLNGNRTEFTENETTQQYQIDPQSNRLLKVEGTSNLVTYQYDETGSLTRRNADTFIYDQRGRLVQANGTSYKVNALGLRVEKTGLNQDIQFVYDEQGHLIGEYDAVSGNSIIEHVWLNDLPVAVIKNSSVFYVYPDHLGTPRAITDDQNRTVWYWNYDEPFGKTEPNDEVSGTKFSYNLRFPGQYYDEETGLHYNWHRDYDAQTGRYIQSDPIGLAGGINSYGYASNNSLKYIDFHGLKYTDEECRLLEEWIMNQWKVYQIYARSATSGERPTGIENVAHTRIGCYTKYKDEGRRKACVAHEKAHSIPEYITAGDIYFEQGVGAMHSYIAYNEMKATLAGILTGERLYNANCNEDCK
jgi:RHS repeat-associated protein